MVPKEPNPPLERSKTLEDTVHKTPKILVLLLAQRTHVSRSTTNRLLKNTLPDSIQDFRTANALTEVDRADRTALAVAEAEMRLF